MRVLALIENADSVCYRYRLEAHSWALAQGGLYLEGARWGNSWRRIRQLLLAARADIVILQRKLLPRWQLSILRRAAHCLVYDLDDALFHRDSYSPKGSISSIRLARFRATVRAADAVLVGNSYLGQYAAAYASTNKIHVVPTCLEPTWYPCAEHARRLSDIRLVWIGQRSMLPSLHEARDHLALSTAGLPGLRLEVICDAAPNLSGIRSVLIPWSSATEAQDLSKTDIGVSWLSDHTWSEGKCGLKVLQYMAAGLPVVANPVGIHRNLIVHGVNGFLASTPAEWAEAIRNLAVDPELRNRMGAAARRRIDAEYSVGRWGPKLADILTRAVRDRLTRKALARSGAAASRSPGKDREGPRNSRQTES